MGKILSPKLAFEVCAVRYSKREFRTCSCILLFRAQWSRILWSLRPLPQDWKWLEFVTRADEGCQGYQRHQVPARVNYSSRFVRLAAVVADALAASGAALVSLHLHTEVGLRSNCQ